MAQAAPQPSMFAVFKKRSFTLLWGAQLISTVADGHTSIAAGMLIYRITGSALSVGLMLMARALPDAPDTVQAVALAPQAAAVGRVMLRLPRLELWGTFVIDHD